MYKMPANTKQSMAVFFMCIIFAIIMALSFIAYFIWKKYCQKNSRKVGDQPPLNQSRQSSRARVDSIDLETSAAQFSEDNSELGDEMDRGGSPLPNSAMYSFPTEGDRCFRHLKPNGFRPGELFAHPSSYRQNLRLVGRTLKTVEEVEEGLDSPPRYEELFPDSASSLLVEEETIFYSISSDKSSGS